MNCTANYDHIVVGAVKSFEEQEEKAFLLEARSQVNDHRRMSWLTQKVGWLVMPGESCSESLELEGGGNPRPYQETNNALCARGS